MKPKTLENYKGENRLPAYIKLHGCQLNLPLFFFYKIGLGCYVDHLNTRTIYELEIEVYSIPTKHTIVAFCLVPTKPNRWLSTGSGVYFLNDLWNRAKTHYCFVQSTKTKGTKSLSARACMLRSPPPPPTPPLASCKFSFNYVATMHAMKTGLVTWYTMHAGPDIIWCCWERK